jgi:iron complex transport system permease protein
VTRPTTVAEAVAEDAAAGGRAPRALRPRIEDGHVRVLGAALPWNARATLVVTVALVLVLISLVLSLTLGRLGIALADLPAVLRGEGSKTEHFVVFTNRLPRAVVGICA